VTVLARQGELPQVRLNESGLIISPLKAATPPATEIARRAAYDRLPRVKITDLLLEVDAWTGFSECFIHRRSGRADDRNALLTVILADGINLGLTRMAETCRGASLRQLAHLHDWHISEAAYGEALGRLIDAHRAMPLAALWETAPPRRATDSNFMPVVAGPRSATSTRAAATNRALPSTPMSRIDMAPSRPG
jgi:hypothetical protein